MESQMYGTPVIGADIGGIPELIRQGETGELFECRSSESLCKKITGLWNDSERRQTYTMGCKELVFDNIEQYCIKLLDVYRSR